jgi:hypothetical protein
VIVHLLVPHLFDFDVSDPSPFADLCLERLERLLSRGRWQPAAPVSPEVWLCRAFAVACQQDWPIAPLTLTLDGGLPGEAYWLRADPIHLQLERDRVRLVDSTVFEVSPTEAIALTDTLNRHFAEEGLAFHPMRPDRWYLRLPAVPRLKTRLITEVIGRDVDAFHPTGEDALRWQRRLTEIQMMLHEHPVNLRREAQGHPPINSVWLWGGGQQVPVPRPAFGAVYARDILSLALARAAGVPGRMLPASAREFLADAQEEGEVLVVLDRLRGAAQYRDVEGWRAGLVALEADWFAPLEAALSAKRLEGLVVIPVPAPAQVQARASDLRRFWRRRRPFPAWAASIQGG